MPAACLASRKQCFRKHRAWHENKRPSETVAHCRFHNTQMGTALLRSFSMLSTDKPDTTCTNFYLSLCGDPLAIKLVAMDSIDSHKLSLKKRTYTRLHHANACDSDTHISNSQTTNRYINGANTELDNEPDIASVLRGSLQDCQYAHAYMVEAGLMGDIYLVNLVLRVYSKLGTMSDARSVFDMMPRPSVISWNTMIGGYANCFALDEASLHFYKMPQRNVVTWNILITAYAHQGKSKEALHLFQQLYLESGLPNEATFVNVLSACSQLEDLKTGQIIHVLICGCGLESSLTLGTTLINMYAKSKDLKSAHSAFHKLHQHDVVSWTSLISAVAQLGYGEVSFNLYRQMQQEGIQPNKLTTQSILSAIAHKLLIKEGKAIHACACFGDFRLDVDIGSALINMYGKCSSLKYAWFVFEDVKSNAIPVWNAMIAACVEQACYWQALSLYYQRLEKGLKLDQVTFANVLSACALLVNRLGLVIHSHIIEEEHAFDVVVNNALITFYSRCNSLEDAIAVFGRMQSHSVVTWTCMLAAYGQGGYNQQAIQLFQQMQLQHVRPNDATIVAALVSCADSIALEEGRTLHAWIALEKKKLNSAVSSGIISMYCKCGALMEAFSVFRSLNDVKNVVIRNAMINGFAYGGHGEAAIVCFHEMQERCIEPDEFTFVGMLSACSHAGMVDEGICCFCFLVGNLYSHLLLEHCICIVDLFGRAGQIAEAKSFVQKVPFLLDTCFWSALQAVSRIHGDSVCEKWTSDHIVEFGC